MTYSNGILKTMEKRGPSCWLDLCSFKHFINRNNAISFNKSVLKYLMLNVKLYGKK